LVLAGHHPPARGADTEHISPDGNVVAPAPPSSADYTFRVRGSEIVEADLQYAR
jgi:hypothetical protein